VCSNRRLLLGAAGTRDGTDKKRNDESRPH
jgi:hypothetical protein